MYACRPQTPTLASANVSRPRILLLPLRPNRAHAHPPPRAGQHAPVQHEPVLRRLLRADVGHARHRAFVLLYDQRAAEGDTVPVPYQGQQWGGLHEGHFLRLLRAGAGGEGGCVAGGEEEGGGVDGAVGAEGGEYAVRWWEDELSRVLICIISVLEERR